MGAEEKLPEQMPGPACCFCYSEAIDFEVSVFQTSEYKRVLEPGAVHTLVALAIREDEAG